MRSSPTIINSSSILKTSSACLWKHRGNSRVCFTHQPNSSISSIDINYSSSFIGITTSVKCLSTSTAFLDTGNFYLSSLVVLSAPYLRISIVMIFLAPKPSLMAKFIYIMPLSSLSPKSLSKLISSLDFKPCVTTLWTSFLHNITSLREILIFLLQLLLTTLLLLLV